VIPNDIKKIFIQQEMRIAIEAVIPQMSSKQSPKEKNFSSGRNKKIR